MTSVTATVGCFLATGLAPEGASLGLNRSAPFLVSTVLGSSVANLEYFLLDLVSFSSKLYEYIAYIADCFRTKAHRCCFVISETLVGEVAL